MIFDYQNRSRLRPIYAHQDDAIVSLYFANVTALMAHTLIERGCG